MYQAVLSVDIAEYLDIVVSMIFDFMENEYSQREPQVVAFINELSTILELKYSNHNSVRSLMVSRLRIFNYDWERRVGIDQYDNAIENENYDRMTFYEGEGFDPDN